MNAFSRGFSASIAARCASVSSRAVNSPRAQPVARLARCVRSVRHHSTTLGTAKKSPARSGALASTLLGIAAVGHHVLAHLQRHLRRAGQRLDAVDIHLVQLLDPAQDAVQLGLQRGQLRILDMDAGERGDAADGRGIERHEASYPVAEISADHTGAAGAVQPERAAERGHGIYGMFRR